MPPFRLYQDGESVLLQNQIKMSSLGGSSLENVEMAISCILENVKLLQKKRLYKRISVT